MSEEAFESGDHRNVTELKSFIVKEAPPPRQNSLLSSSSGSLSERETCSSPIVYICRWIFL